MDNNDHAEVPEHHNDDRRVFGDDVYGDEEESRPLQINGFHNNEPDIAALEDELRRLHEHFQEEYVSAEGSVDGEEPVVVNGHDQAAGPLPCDEVVSHNTLSDDQNENASGTNSSTSDSTAEDDGNMKDKIFLGRLVMLPVVFEKDENPEEEEETDESDESLELSELSEPSGVYALSEDDDVYDGDVYDGDNVNDSNEYNQDNSEDEENQ